MDHFVRIRQNSEYSETWVYRFYCTKLFSYVGLYEDCQQNRGSR